MKVATHLFLWITLFIFILGFFVCLHPSFKREKLINILSSSKEGFSKEPVIDENNKKNSCPDVLIKSGSKLFLYNTQLPKGSPKVFSSLDEYIMYTKIQRLEKNIRCPVLFLQEENNTQGENVFRMRPSPTNLEGGAPLLEKTDSFGPNHPLRLVDATRENPPYNTNLYPGFDPYGYDQGVFTKLDERHYITENGNKISDNPMDENWGGVQFSQSAVESGKYDENKVYKPSMVPKVIPVR